MLQIHHFRSSNSLFPFNPSANFTLSSLSLTPSLNFPYSIKPHATTTLHPVSAHNHRANPEPWSVQLAEEPTAAATDAGDPTPEEGPVEIPSSAPSIFYDSENPTTLQAATSLLLTGAISVFLFRSLRRRAQRAKEMKLRSSAAKKSLKEEALESLKAVAPTPIDAKAPPSPLQAFVGGLTAGVIALILYKFTTTIEASLNRQTLSDNFSVRQITITIRTFVNGLCYLATCVFGLNSLGLFLYSGQLAINSFMGESATGASKDEGESQSSLSQEPSEGPIDSSRMKIVDEDQSSDSTK